MATYLITGGAGFIGSHIAQELLKRQDHVRILDDLSVGTIANIASFYNRIEFFRGDITDSDIVAKAMDGVDYVIHQAARISIIESFVNPQLYHRINVAGTFQILEQARKYDVKRVVLASSSAVYGKSEILPLQESLQVIPISPYAVTKYVDELYAAMFYRLYGLETVCLRYFNIYGPGQTIDSPYAAVIPRFINKLLCGEKIQIFGDGEQTRDFVYVDDVVNANLLACQVPEIGGEVFNVAGGIRVSVNSIYKSISDILNTQAVPEYLPSREGEVIDSQAAIDKAVKFLRFNPAVTLEDGLKKTIDWFRLNSQQ